MVPFSEETKEKALGSDRNEQFVGAPEEVTRLGW